MNFSFSFPIPLYVYLDIQTHSYLKVTKILRLMQNIKKDIQQKSFIFGRYDTIVSHCACYNPDVLINTVKTSVHAFTHFTKCLEVLTVPVCMVMSYACFGPWHSPYSYYQCRASDIAVIILTSLAISTRNEPPRR